MSKLTDREVGLLFVLAEDFRKRKLPRVLQLKAKIDRSLKLSNAELAFLQCALQDACLAFQLTQKKSPLEELCIHITTFYIEVSQCVFKLKNTIKL